MTGIQKFQDIDWQEKLPDAFQLRMQRMLGSEYDAFLASYKEQRRPGLRLNVLKKGWERLEAAIVSGEWYRQWYIKQNETERNPNNDYASEPGDRYGACHETISREDAVIPWSPHSFYYPVWARPGRHPFHEAGVYYIQEPSAMAVAALSGVKPGQWVLDLCAAPGGKSTQLASMLQGRGVLVSNEIHPARARILSQNIERMGIRNAVVTNEDPGRLAGRFPAVFDTVVVDAPCSGEGMFRREEAAIPNWSPENVTACAERQRGILDCAAEMTADGGTLVYSTCTFAPVEDEGNAAAFLQRHPEFTLVDLPAELGEDFLARTGITCGHSRTLRLWPHRLEGEGHFIAMFRKEGSAPSETLSGAGSGYYARPGSRLREGRSVKETSARPGNRKNGRGRPEKPEEEGVRAWRRFAEESLAEKAVEQIEGPAAGAGRFVSFGNELYIMPCSLDLKGLKVLRPGLHLGTVKKGRFEPSHALALTISQEDAKCCAEAGADVMRFLHGESLTAGDCAGAPGSVPAEGAGTARQKREPPAHDGTCAQPEKGFGEPQICASPCRVTKSGGDGKGWCLITVSGFSLGWGKLVGGRIKNHYPKGLRVQ